MSFDAYLSEFQSVLKRAEQLSSSSGGQAPDEESLSTVEDLLQQCNELLQQMALEARGNSNGVLKKKQLQITRDCKTQVQTLQQQYDKNVLMASASNNQGSNSQRQALLQQKDQLKTQNSKLDNARKIIEETEQVALEITSELGHNRETLESAHGRIHQVSSMTGRATRIVQSLNRRAVQQKMMLYGMTAGIFMLFCLMVWWMR